MTIQRRLVFTDQNTSLWLDFCDDCGCAVSSSITHRCHAGETVVATEDCEDGEDADIFNDTVVPYEPYGPPLSLVLRGLDDARYHFSGRKRDPEPDMSHLDVGERAALVALLRDTLAKIERPTFFASGGLITGTGPSISTTTIP